MCDDFTTYSSMGSARRESFGFVPAASFEDLRFQAAASLGAAIQVLTARDAAHRRLYGGSALPRLPHLPNAIVSPSRRYNPRRGRVAGVTSHVSSRTAVSETATTTQENYDPSSAAVVSSDAMVTATSAPRRRQQQQQRRRLESASLRRGSSGAPRGDVDDVSAATDDVHNNGSQDNSDASISSSSGDDGDVVKSVSGAHTVRFLSPAKLRALSPLRRRWVLAEREHALRTHLVERGQLRQQIARKRREFNVTHTKHAQGATWAAVIKAAAFAQSMIQEIKAAAARARLVELFTPCLRLRMRLAQRRKETRRAARTIEAPTAEALEEDDVLRLFPTTHLERAATAMRLRYVAAGDVLMYQGERGSEAFLLAKGEFTVLYAASKRTPAAPMAILRPPEVVGAIGMISGELRTATVRVSSPGGGFVWAVDKDHFLPPPVPIGEIENGSPRTQRYHHPSVAAAISRAVAEITRRHEQNLGRVYQQALPAAALRRCAAFAGISDAAVAYLRAQGTFRVVHAGSALMQTGEPVHHAALVLRGAVRCVLRPPGAAGEDRGVVGGHSGRSRRRTTVALIDGEFRTVVPASAQYGQLGAAALARPRTLSEIVPTAIDVFDPRGPAARDDFFRDLFGFDSHDATGRPVGPGAGGQMSAAPAVALPEIRAIIGLSQVIFGDAAECDIVATSSCDVMFIPQTALFHLAMIDPPSLLALRHALLSQRQAWLRRPPRLALLRAVMHRVSSDTDLHARFTRGVQTGQLYQSPEFRTVAAMQPVVFDEGETITVSFPDDDALLIVAGRLEGRQYNHYHQHQQHTHHHHHQLDASDAADPREAAGAAIGVNPAHVANLGRGFAPFLWPPLEDVYFATRSHQVRTATRVEAWRVPRRWIVALLRSMGPRLMAELEAVLYVMYERSAGHQPSLEHAPVVAGPSGGRASGGSMAAALLSNALPPLDAFAVNKDHDVVGRRQHGNLDYESSRPSRAASARGRQPTSPTASHAAGGVATARPHSTSNRFQSCATSIQATPLPSPSRTRAGTLTNESNRSDILIRESASERLVAGGRRHSSVPHAVPRPPGHTSTTGPAVVGSMGAAAAMKERAAAAERERSARLELQRQERAQLKIQAENQKLFARVSAMAKEAAMRPPVTSAAPEGVVSAFQEAAALAHHNAQRRLTLIGVAVNSHPSSGNASGAHRPLTSNGGGTPGGNARGVSDTLPLKYAATIASGGATASSAAAPASLTGRPRTERSKSLADFGVPDDGVMRGPAPPAVSVLLGAYLGVADGGASSGGLSAVGGVVDLAPSQQHGGVGTSHAPHPPPQQRQRVQRDSSHLHHPGANTNTMRGATGCSPTTTGGSKRDKSRVDISKLPQFGEVLLAAARAADQPGEDSGAFGFATSEGAPRGRAALRHLLMQ